MQQLPVVPGLSLQRQPILTFQDISAGGHLPALKQCASIAIARCVLLRGQAWRTAMSLQQNRNRDVSSPSLATLRANRHWNYFSMFQKKNNFQCKNVRPAKIAIKCNN